MTHYPRRPLAYVRVPTDAANAYERFYSDLLGCEAIQLRPGCLAFRCDSRARSIVVSNAERESTIGLELSDDAMLGEMKDHLSRMGVAWVEMAQDRCADRLIRAGISVDFGAGYHIELVVGPRISARRFYPTVDSGLDGLSTLGLKSTRIDEDVRFWVDVLGARVSDRVGDIAYLRLDEAHHRIALYPSDTRGVLYIGIGIRSSDYLMQNTYGLQERQVQVVHGPGCESASGRLFVRMQGPEHILISLEYDEQEVRPDRQPRYFELSHESLCMWGSRCTEVKELAIA